MSLHIRVEPAYRVAAGFVEAFCAAKSGQAVPYNAGGTQVTEWAYCASLHHKNRTEPPAQEQAIYDAMRFAWDQHEAGRAHLVQRREADGTLTYLAVKASRP